MKKYLSYITALLAAGTFATSCDFDESPKSQASVDMVFSSEGGLKLEMYGFYNALPTKTDVYKQNTTIDFGPKNAISGREVGAYTTVSSDSWSWSSLRNINFFLENNVNPAVSESVRNNYNGIARFFRAYFYYAKLVQYGEVPWVEKVFNSPEDPDLFNGRDSRDVIIENIIADLDYAYEHITASSATTNSSLINKWTAVGFKSRVCLFEAAWRKYHANDEFTKGCTKYSANDLYVLAADAAKKVMDGGKYSIYTGTEYADGRGSYRQLFTADNAVTSEVMLAIVADETLNIGEQNWWYNSSTYGPHLGMSRKMALTYLNSDGTPYNEKKEDGSYKTFIEETTGRDTRLNETIRGWDYTRKNNAGKYEPCAVNYTGHALSGYQVTKWVIDDILYDDHSSNGNDEPLMRFAEILLNYAEAKAELGTLTDADWAATIGKLRARGGITGGTASTGTLTSMPTGTPDPYMAAYYPAIATNATLLEIRRERTIELAYEGFRLNDLKRWNCCDLWEKDPWEGVFVPAINTPLDMNGDGVLDVYYYTEGSAPEEYKGIAMKVGTGSSNMTVNLKKVDGGYMYIYPANGKQWPKRQYLDPIPQMVQQRNSNLSQNPGWE